MSMWSGRTRLPFLIAAAAVTLSVSTRPANAAGEEDAANRHGLDLRRQGKDQEALEEFQKIYVKSKSARALAQVALAEQALGRWVDAEAHMLHALSDATHPWIRKNAPTLKIALDEMQRHIGSLEVIGPQGAEARINGQSVGTLPFARPVRVPIGTLNIEVRKEGWLPTTRPVSITAGVLMRESIGLQPAPAAVTQPVEAVRTPVLDLKETSSRQFGSRGADVDDRGEDRSRDQAQDRAQDRGGDRGGDEGRNRREDRGDSSASDSGGGTWQRPAAWAAAVTAVLAGAAGGGALVIRGKKLEDARNFHCNISDGTVNPADPANGGRCLDLANSSSTLGVAAVVSFSVAGALAIGSGLLFVLAPSKSSTPASVACAPVFAVPGAVCQMRF